jgi:hypothetical protein
VCHLYVEQVLRCFLRQGTKQVQFWMAPMLVQRSVQLYTVACRKVVDLIYLQMRLMNRDGEGDKVTTPISSSAAKRPSRKEKARTQNKNRPVHEVSFSALKFDCKIINLCLKRMRKQRQIAKQKSCRLFLMLVRSLWYVPVQCTRPEGTRDHP